MGSAPTYNPAHLIDRPGSVRWLYNPKNDYPLLDRAIAGALPDGSTFKVITATAALESGTGASATPTTTRASCCTGGTLPAQRRRLRPTARSTCSSAIQRLRRRLLLQPRRPHERPCDRRPYAVNYPKGWPLQEWANRFGIGRTTGIDLPGESERGDRVAEAAAERSGRRSGSAIRRPGSTRAVTSSPALKRHGNAILSGGCGIAMRRDLDRSVTTSTPASASSMTR